MIEVPLSFEGGVNSDIIIEHVGPGSALVSLPKLIVRAGAAQSASEARRLINQGGVQLISSDGQSHIIKSSVVLVWRNDS